MNAIVVGIELIFRAATVEVTIVYPTARRLRCCAYISSLDRRFGSIAHQNVRCRYGDAAISCPRSGAMKASASSRGTLTVVFITGNRQRQERYRRDDRMLTG